MSHSITIETIVKAPLATVWERWTNPRDIEQWNAASDDWCCPKATNDLRVGGTFSSRMEAKDKSEGFDFEGTYTAVTPHQHIAYVLADDRKIDIHFEEVADGVKVTETFDTEDENSAEMQRAGWQAIMDRFKAHVERQA